MSLSLFANVLLLAALGFIGLAALGDTLASRQMATERYRYVPLVRLLRRAQWPAIVAGLAFVVSSLAASPLWSVTALLVGFLLAMVGQFRMLACGGNYQAMMRGFLPALVLGMLAVNSGLLPAVPTLQLNMPALCAAALLAAGYWYVAHQRTQQDLLRLRD